MVASYGISNYSTAETERLVAICKDKGYPLPTVFQGLYNPINRRIETDVRFVPPRPAPLPPPSKNVRRNDPKSPAQT